MGTFLISLSLQFSGRQPHAALPVFAIWYQSFFLLFRRPHHIWIPVKSAPLPSALASFSCCGFRSFFSPEQLLLCEREEAGQSRHKSFSCCGERTNMSGWGEVIQEISGRGCGRLESQHTLPKCQTFFLFCFSKAEPLGCSEVSCLKPMLILLMH